MQAWRALLGLSPSSASQPPLLGHCCAAWPLPLTHTWLLLRFQVVLLPLLAGAAAKVVLPSQVAAAAPLASVAALALTALTVGSVLAGNAQSALAAGPRLVAAVAAVQAGEGKRWLRHPLCWHKPAPLHTCCPAGCLVVQVLPRSCMPLARASP